MINRRASYSTYRFGFVLLTLTALLFALAPMARSADDTKKVTTVDQIQFQQSNAQAQMVELQDRMFHLAELTREAEPDDAARLLLAVRTAREQLIIEKMRGALDLLSSKDFSHATEEQAQIIAKLEELKKLLTTGAADLQIMLEKLRALNNAITKLDGAIREEKRQQNSSGAVANQAKNDGKAPDPKTLTGMKQDQQQNRKTTDSIAEAVKTLGGAATAAAGNLGNASGSMSVAEGHLGSGKPSDAQGQQASAVDSMEQAKKQLAQERDKVLAELEKMVRQQVVTNLQEMLDRQKSVRGGTELAVEHMNQPQTAQKIKQLGGAETAIVRIADQTLTLIQETQFSVALPPALKRVQQKCAVIAATLDDSKADAKLIASEVQVERDLQDLLDTFKELSASKVKPGQCNCKGDHNKLEAELKVVRLMQLRVNEDTKTVDGDRAPAAPQVAAADLPANINPLLKEKILAVHDGQAEVHEALEQIHEQLNGPDDPAPAVN